MDYCNEDMKEAKNAFDPAPEKGPENEENEPLPYREAYPEEEAEMEPDLVESPRKKFGASYDAPYPVGEKPYDDPIYTKKEAQPEKMSEHTLMYRDKVWNLCDDVRRACGISSMELFSEQAMLSYASFLETGRFRGQGADYLSSILEGTVRRENEKTAEHLFKTAVGIEMLVRVFTRLCKWDDAKLKNELKESILAVESRRGVLYGKDEAIWDS